MTRSTLLFSLLLGCAGYASAGPGTQPVQDPAARPGCACNQRQPADKGAPAWQGFHVDALAEGDSTRVVNAAHYLEQTADNRPRIDAAFVLRTGAQPAWRVALEGSTVYFSRPFAGEDGHRFVLAFVEQHGRIDARVFYRSNSQFSWRACDATGNGHLGKGFHEFDKELPIALSVALHTAGAAAPSSRLAGAHPSADEARALLRGLTESQSAAGPGKVVLARDGRYWSRDYAAYVASEPIPWSAVSATLPSPSGLPQADPDATRLPAQDELPDLRHPLYRFTFDNEAYAPFAGGNAKVTGEVYPSFDGRLQYLFFSDASGRAFLSSVELPGAPLTPYGVRANYLDVRGMNAPLMDYSFQIPTRFGGSARADYADNWAYVQRQPIVAYFLRERARSGKSE